MLVLHTQFAQTSRTDMYACAPAHVIPIFGRPINRRFQLLEHLAGQRATRINHLGNVSNS
jgi:hypothetical protein